MRFTCATWRPVQNHGGPMTGQNGLVLHHAVANGSLFDLFNNPAPGGDPSKAVSAHFWVALDGRIEQYVDSEIQAWHGVSLNAAYCGVETEGCVTAPYAQPMTTAMVNALGKLYAEGHQKHGWPNQLANALGQRGFGYHRMAVNTACPCDVRLAERPAILAVAFGSTPPAPVPKPPPTSHPPFPGTLLINFTEGHGTNTWQGRMRERGWTIAVDDLYGDQSESVCRAFQTEKGLGLDGIVGPETWDAAWTAPIT